MFSHKGQMLNRKGWGALKLGLGVPEQGWTSEWLGQWTWELAKRGSPEGPGFQGKDEVKEPMWLWMSQA